MDNFHNKQTQPILDMIEEATESLWIDDDPCGNGSICQLQRYIIETIDRLRTMCPNYAYKLKIDRLQGYYKELSNLRPRQYRDTIELSIYPELDKLYNIIKIKLIRKNLQVSD